VSYIVINAITVPEGAAGTELERRFAARAGAVDGQPGFVRFQLLRPADDRDAYFVLTEWASKADFETWLQSRDFAAGHGHGGGHGGDATPDAPQRPPVSTQTELLQFEVVDLDAPAGGAGDGAAQ
jgi:heme-degrading monooxygenase HmoA